MKAIIENLVRYIAYKACRLRFLSQAIFRIDFAPVGKEDYYFDVTTPVIVKKAAEILSRDSRVLDMGTGSSCVIGLSLWKKFGCHVMASDINPEIIALAGENIRRNRAPVRVISSRFFDNVDENFDIVIFNPPYVPTGKGEAQGLPRTRRTQWDGGLDGTDTVKGFLDAFGKLHYPLKALLGVNFLRIPRETILDMLKKKRDISVDSIYRHPILPVDIYRLHR